MYHIYTTDSLILKRKNFGEGNVLLYVLTKDLGLIMASAQSVRSHKSKLSPALVEYSLSSISFIKGKNGWKITNAISKENLFFGYPDFVKNIIAKISTVLIKLITGEEKHPEIFESVISGLEFLKNVKKEDDLSFESLFMLKILYHLGYIAMTDNLKVFLENNIWSNELLEKVYLNRSELIILINKGLKESHL